MLTFQTRDADEYMYSPLVELKAEGSSQGGNWTMSESREVGRLYADRSFSTTITFVQTDKPIYKPGQLGK